MYLEYSLLIKNPTTEQISFIESIQNGIFRFDENQYNEDNYYLYHGEDNPWLCFAIKYSDNNTSDEIISSIRELVEYCKSKNLICEGEITIDPEQDDEYIEIDITNNVISIE